MKTSRRCFKTFIVFLFLSLVPLSGQIDARSGSVQWRGYEEGMSLGKTEGKKIFMFFWADWCKFCEQMERETLAKPSVVRYLNDNFISIKVNSDVEKRIASSYFVRGLPTLWFLGKNGEKIGYHPGFVSSDVLLPYLRYIHSDQYKTISFQDFLKRS